MGIRGIICHWKELQKVTAAALENEDGSGCSECKNGCVTNPFSSFRDLQERTNAIKKRSIYGRYMIRIKDSCVAIGDGWECIREGACRHDEACTKSGCKRVHTNGEKRVGL